MGSKVSASIPKYVFFNFERKILFCANICILMVDQLPRTQAAASSADASTAGSSPHDSCPLAAARTADSGSSTTERQAATQ